MPHTAQIRTLTALPVDRAPAGSSHAKAILTGEHAVVYGAPAIAIPVTGIGVTATLLDGDGWVLDSELYHGPVSQAPAHFAPIMVAWRVTAKRLGSKARGGTLRIDSDIPLQRGLGSSAAVAAAVVRATAAQSGVTVHADELHDIVQEAERIAHGTPSGIDAASVVATTPLRFQRGTSMPLSPGAPLHIVIADSGIASATASAVGGVRELRERDHGRVDRAIARIAEGTEQAQRALVEGALAELGGIMDRNHTELRELGVSTDRLDALVQAARDGGALGAKLTGSGGGGCIVALAPSADTVLIERILREAGATRTWHTSLEKQV